MMDIGIHDVRRVEICRRYRSNAGSRTIRITSDTGSVELTLYGNTIALDLLPRSSDFYDFDEAGNERPEIREDASPNLPAMFSLELTQAKAA